LTRMDALLAATPALVVHALGRRPRIGRLVAAAAPIAGAVGAWSLYCARFHGTWRFWGHSVDVNLETGGGNEASRLDWLLDGLGVAVALGAQVLPSRIGWMPWVGLIAGLLATPWLRHDLRRTLSILTLGLLGFWLSIGVVGQHAPGHNLYWKWLYGVAPFLILVGVSGAWRLLGRLRPALGPTAVGALAAAGMLQAVYAMGVETSRQLALSAALYRPQLELARWIEAEVPESTTILVDNIPGCWIDRRPHGRTMWTWFDVPVPPGDEEAFAAWIEEEELGYVLWFREEWTQAPVVAPWLDSERPVELPGVTLIPLRQDSSYGWIFFEVVR